MGLGRRLADLDGFGDLGVVQPESDADEHLALAFGQAIETVGFPRVEDVVVGDLFDEPAGERRCSIWVALSNTS
jgi:hypothetical protein